MEAFFIIHDSDNIKCSKFDKEFDTVGEAINLLWRRGHEWLDEQVNELKMRYVHEAYSHIVSDSIRNDKYLNRIKLDGFELVNGERVNAKIFIL